MAFKRDAIRSDDGAILGATKSPIDTESGSLLNRTAETTDRQQIEKDYKSDSSNEGGGISTGAFIPQDMTVKLVRADSANWEIFLSFLYSLTLTFFGIFMGAWISNKNVTTSLEKTATISLGVISIILIFAWGSIKFKQKKSQIRISNKILESYKEE
jgi:hypothetical protein